MVEAPVAMSHGYHQQQQEDVYSPYTQTTSSNTENNKLYHPNYRSAENHPSRSHQWSRPPPPNYNANYQQSSPPPPILASHHPPSGVSTSGASTSSGSSSCMCTSCSRPPQYHPPPLPHSSSLPHYSQQSQQSWTPPPPQPQAPPPSHQQGAFNSPQHGVPPTDFPPPNTSWSSGMTSMTAYERNNNEASMISSSRYGQLPESSRYSSMQDTSARYSPASDMRHMQAHDVMPHDPREWSSLDVQRWIQWASITFKLKAIPQERFQMNGKALCLMDLSMFLFRVPDGGQRLYDDFQTRLKKALSHDQPPKIM